MAAKKGKLLALDWDVRTLRVVYAAFARRGVTIERVLSVNIPSDVNPDEPAEMGAHIRRVLTAQHISTKHALVDIPRDQVVLKTLQLPPISMDEMPGLVQIQIAKELPFPVDEAAIDFAVEGEAQGDGRVDVLVAAVRNDVLAKYTETLSAAGLKLDRVGLRPYAGKVAVTQLLKHGLPERVMVLDIRPTLTEISVLRSTSGDDSGASCLLSFSRAASVHIPEFKEEPGSQVIPFDGGSGIHNLSDKNEDSGVEACVRALMMEVMRTMEAYRGKDAAGSIDHIVVCGDLGVEEKLIDVIQERLEITAEIYNPASTFGWEPDEGAEAASFSAPLGLVLGHVDDGQLHFDFLHPKRVVTVTERRLKKAPMIAAVIALFLVAGITFGAKVTSQDRQARDQLKKDIAALKDAEKDNKKFRKFMNEIRDFDEQLVWIDVLDDIMKILPSHQELVVEGIEMDQAKRLVKLRTIGKQPDTALNAEDALEAFRREGKTMPRFDVRLGTQSESTGDLYPYKQELKITVKRDEKKKKTQRRG
ncbi:MAG: pilus assembly protein PilM [Planctomycetota bacterium]